MSIKRFKGAGIYSAKSSKVWDQVTTLNDFQSIATVIVPSGGQATISFTNIPQNFTHLQLRCSLGTNRAATLDTAKMTFNSSTGSSYYTEHSIYGDGTSAGVNAFSVTNPTSNIVFARTGGTSNALTFAATITDIADYTNTSKFKTLRSMTGATLSGAAGEVEFISGCWIKAGTGVTSDAINRIDIVPVVGTLFTQYSQIALYGIKGA